ncbi:hypothetical protein C8A03DRAFT_18598 [Achaetomium macrosporum]|uniref:DUF7907 domain-containing protein n=1 Tax=Achaetomium macrosporum TaxID=79813 RepID=A0AAN7HB49_9PEZI|nr:hypothetical protein C8A03DRAFT_18598 [Achaetomium macrosporum]
MRFLLPTLGIAAAATALSPATTSSSKGFYLIAHVTDPSRDFSPSIEGWALTAIHTGAGLNAAVLASASAGRLFYENGTAAQVAATQSTILTDAGTPPFPMGLYVQGEGEPPKILEINVGAGTPNTIVGREADVLVNGLDANGLGRGTYMACNATVPYYGVEYITLQYAYGKVSDGCAPIELRPRCATLNDLPADSLSSHEFAVVVPCYE